MELLETAIDLIKMDLQGSPASPPRASPVRIREQNAVRKNVIKGLRQSGAPTIPHRQISDPDTLPTCGKSVSDRASVFEPKQPPEEGGANNQKKGHVSPKKRKKKKLAARMTAFDQEYQKQNELELREEARKYNPAKHGLVGILKWSAISKNLSVRFTEKLILGPTCRRSSLDVVLNDKATLNDKALYPRRSSMSDVDRNSDQKLTFLVEEKAKRATSLLRAAVQACMFLSRFRCNKALAATSIQAMVRGFLKRRHFSVVVLEHKLEQIELQRLRDLEEVRHRKWKRMEKIRDDLEADARARAEMVEKAVTLVKYLREENEKLEVKDKKIEDQSELMKKMNMQYRVSTKLLLDNQSTMSYALDLLNEKNTMLVRDHVRYEALVKQFNSELAEMDNRAEQEQRARESMEATLGKIMTSTHLRCEDPMLVTDAEAINNRVHQMVLKKIDRTTFERTTSLRGLDNLPDMSTDCDIAVGTFAKLGCSFRSIDTTSGNSFANMTVDDDQMTMCTTVSSDSFASGFTQ
jgi:hypothetical protein